MVESPLRLHDPVARASSRHAGWRERSRLVAARVESGESPYFSLDRSRLPALADRVAGQVRERSGAVMPYHSVWRCFDADGVDRKADLDAALRGRTTVGVARARIGLAMIGVLLGDGAAIDVFQAFLAGRFSSDPGDRCRVDAKALLRLDPGGLNDLCPMSGPDPAVDLLRGFGACLRARPDLFTDEGQPGHLFDTLTHRVHVHHLLHANLHHLKPPVYRHHVNAGRMLDVLADAFAPTLAQDPWTVHRIALSLLEPFEWAGVRVDDIDAIAAVPDAIAMTLLVDAGVLLPRKVTVDGSERLAEQRTLTVSLIDDLATLVRQRLGMSAEQMPSIRLQQVWQSS